MKKNTTVIVCVVVIVLAIAAIGYQLFARKGGAIDQKTGQDLTQPLELGTNPEVPPSPPTGDPGAVDPMAAPLPPSPDAAGGG